MDLFSRANVCLLSAEEIQLASTTLYLSGLASEVIVIHRKQAFQG